MKTEYQRKLAHPEWQKKRLEVLSRDGFRCQDCSSEDKELHVHHKYYIPGKEPQDYPIECYVTLCHECHDYEEQKLKSLQENVVPRLRRLGAEAFSIEYLIDQVERFPKDNTSNNIVWTVGDMISDFRSLSEEQRKFVTEYMMDCKMEKVKEYMGRDNNNG